MMKRYPVTKQHIGELASTFNKYDADQSNSLELDEMRSLLGDIDKKMTQLPAVSILGFSPPIITLIQ